MHRMQKGVVSVVTDPLGGALREFSTTITGERVDLFQNAGVSNNPSDMAMFIMAPYPGRNENCISGVSGLMRHPHKHGLHGTGRNTMLNQIHSSPHTVQYGGKLVSTPEFELPTEMGLAIEIEMLENGFEYGLHLTNFGPGAAQGDAGLHMMLLQDPFNTGEQILIEHHATEWWPPASHLEIPTGTRQIAK